MAVLRSEFVKALADESLLAAALRRLDFHAVSAKSGTVTYLDCTLEGVVAGVTQ